MKNNNLLIAIDTETGEQFLTFAEYESCVSVNTCLIGTRPEGLVFELLTTKSDICYLADLKFELQEIHGKGFELKKYFEFVSAPSQDMTFV